MTSLARSSVLMVTLLCLSTQVRAQAVSPFQDACRERLPQVQADRRVCIVGIVRDGNNVDVLVSTRDDLVGRRVAVYASSVVQSARFPLAEMSGLNERIVVIGGFIDGSALYSAKVLSGGR